jgi:hypothetical protein
MKTKLNLKATLTGLSAFCGLLILAMSSCSTDIELNAPYQKTAVVFGLLDAQQDTQWFGSIEHGWALAINLMRQ